MRQTNPLRDVVYIEIARPGRNGGQPWLLTLECGHLAVRSRGNTKDTLRVAARLFKGPMFAPKRCRCVLCGERERASQDKTESVE